MRFDQQRFENRIIRRFLPVMWIAHHPAIEPVTFQFEQQPVLRQPPPHTSESLLFLLQHERRAGPIRYLAEDASLRVNIKPAASLRKFEDWQFPDYLPLLLIQAPDLSVSHECVSLHHLQQLGAEMLSDEIILPEHLGSFAKNIIPMIS